MGNRVYTGLGEDELYFVVRGNDLAALADALDVITGPTMHSNNTRSDAGRNWQASNPSRISKESSGDRISAPYCFG
jgi:hypothetical protein